MKALVKKKMYRNLLIIQTTTSNDANRLLKAHRLENYMQNGDKRILKEQRKNNIHLPEDKEYSNQKIPEYIRINFWQRKWDNKILSANIILMGMICLISSPTLANCFIWALSNHYEDDLKDE